MERRGKLPRNQWPEDPRAERKLLERLASRRFEKCEPEWRALLRQVRLGLIYAVPIGDVLREGGWREKKNPLGYIKQAGRRRAIRMGLVDRPRRRDREVLACDLNYTQWDSEELGREPDMTRSWRWHSTSTSGSMWCSAGDHFLSIGYIVTC